MTKDNLGEIESAGSYEPMSPELVRINRFLNQRDELAGLCGEILATLLLQANQPFLVRELKNDIERWQRRYEKSSGNV